MYLNDTDLEYILTHAKSDILALKDARLFITGGTGFIGCWLLESLCYANNHLNLGATATVLSRNPDDFISQYPHFGGNSAISIFAGDVRDFEFPKGDFTHTIHAATDVVAINKPLDTFNVTVDGTRRVLEFCRQRQVKDVLILSSGAVYGRIPYDIDLVSEEYFGAPATDNVNSAYGIGKIASEWLGTAYSVDNEMSCKSARIFAQVGPYLALDKQFAAGNFILNVLKGEDILIKGDGTPCRSYMYAADLAIWLWGILIRGASCRAYNVGSDHSISIHELALTIATVAEVPDTKIEILNKPVLGRMHERYVPDISRARNELGLKINIPLEEALQRTINWYRPMLKK